MTNVAATIDDLRHVAENGKAELVKGELVLMSPTGGLPGYAAGEIFASLREYAQRTRTGHAFADNVGFIVDLPARQSFSHRRGEAAAAEPAVAGWTLAVDRLFPD